LPILTRQHVVPNAQVLCFPNGKTKFVRPDGSIGKEPGNGILLLGACDVANDALRRSGLGVCMTVDRTPGRPGNTQYGNASPQFPAARDMAMYCYQHMDNLNDWENEFIANMVSLTRRGYPLSIKRQDKLKTIYLKLGGRT
jgi:hypothetical protein